MGTLEAGRWQPMSHEQFRGLRPGDRLADREGREWTVSIAPLGHEEPARVLLVSGPSLARGVIEHSAGDYMLLSAETT
jgi:hypothetical protein